MSMVPSSEYEHWPDSSTVFSGSPSAISGYDTFNGLRECEYVPADDDKATVKAEAKPVANSKKEVKKTEVKIAPKPEAPKSEQPKMLEPQPIQYAYPPQYTAYPQMSYAAHPNYALPAPAYYGFPQAQMQQQCYAAPPGYFCAPVAVAPPAPAAENKGGKGGKKEKSKPKKPEPMKWQGRTKSEVEEDNMKIAAKEGAYEARKIEPVGLGDDQPVWVVLGDGTPVLRHYAEAKEMKGEWHEDPRFKGSLYLVCEQDKAEEKRDGNGEKGGKKGKKGKKGVAKEKKEEDEAEDGEEGEAEKKCACAGCTCGK